MEMVNIDVISAMARMLDMIEFVGLMMEENWKWIEFERGNLEMRVVI